MRHPTKTLKDSVSDHVAQYRSVKIRELWNIRILMLTMALFLLGCDDQENAESGVSSGSSEPAQVDLAQARRIAGEAETGAIVPKSVSNVSPLGSNDLSVLGGYASKNQQAFRQRFDLADPT